MPAVGLPVSQVFSGAENLAPPVELKAVAKPKPKTCRKGYVRKKGRCVKKATHKRKGQKAANKRRAKR